MSPSLEGRRIFLVDRPLEEALELVKAAYDAAGVRNDETEVVPLEAALDRVTARPVFARLSSPHYHACAMDGVALAATATVLARESAPVELQLGSEAILVDTGDPLPAATDAVVMIEDVEVRGERVAIRTAVAPWTNVRPIGEDIVATEAVVPARRLLGPAELAAIASAGIVEIPVVRIPRVGIITTGDELVDPGVAVPARGSIVDSNGVLLAAAVRRYGGEPVRYPAVRDDPKLIGAAVDRALAGCEVVVVNAGSSAGSEDHTAAVFAQRGEVVVHGVAIRPGHPMVVAVSGRTPLLGIPGYPVSAAICADLFLRPLIERLAHRDAADEIVFDVVLARKLFSPLGEDEYVRAVAGRVEGRLVATPLRRGAGVITSLARANCLLVIPRFQEGAHAGATVRARALRSLRSIERTLLAVGSHDVALDLVAGALAGHDVELVSANVGSIAGLVALADGGTHLAGTHVLDPATRSYNDAAVRRFGPRDPVALIQLARRTQGLIVARDNPLCVSSIADLARTRARFVNRQRDAGTRLLFDALLADAGLEPSAIVGYDRIEYTHLAVAALVADGSADAGLGILAAARALGCDFIPLADEPYELAIRTSSLEDAKIVALLEVLRDPLVRAQIEMLGGYDCTQAGTVRVPV